jgi:hypothetical protein
MRASLESDINEGIVRMKKRYLQAGTRILAISALMGCGCGAVPNLPRTFDVATSASEKSEVPAGTGPASFASSTWSLVRVADPEDSGAGAEDDSTPGGPYGGLLSGDALDRPPVGERIFLVEFGDQGQMTRVTENRFFLAQFYGSDVPVGGEWRRSTLLGVTYHSASYGLEVAERFGLAVVVDVRFGALYLGRAIPYSWGTLAGDSIDGTFGYLLDFTDGIVPSLGTIADQYPIEGQRVPP